LVAGAALMALYRRTDSLLPPMAAHYLINLWDFL
jgi:membrane protease YdiL (CAAX protease family)